MEAKIETSDQITVGYHGTSRRAAEVIVQTHFKLSDPGCKPYLGDGAYFFENQLSQAKRWALTRFGNPAGTVVAVVQSKIRFGNLLNLTDRETLRSVEKFRREYGRKAKVTPSLAVVIDIVAEILKAEVVKAIRIPEKFWSSEAGFSADIEVILAVREIKNILSKEIIWSQMTKLQ